LGGFRWPARFVVPDLPHHVTQRGNRRMQTFSGDEDYGLNLDLLSERCRQAGVAVWSGYGPGRFLTV
jgi:putative transposase